MDPVLRARLSARMEARLCTVRVNVVRMVIDADGAGGQTMTWRQVDHNVPARWINVADSELVQDEAVRATASWDIVLPTSTQVLPQDRITVTGDDRTYDVVGTNAGQTDLLVQVVRVQERVA